MGDPDEESVAPKPPAKKQKKRPSDFEIARTIFQRCNQRKLPFLLKNLGEEDDIYFLCSKDEKEFTYGSPDISICLIEITSPELKAIVDSEMDKLYGLSPSPDQHLIINIRDQISALAKNKGLSIEAEVQKDLFGSVWTTVSDINGKEKIIYFAKAINSLFHMHMIKDWCQRYRQLLSHDDETHLYVPYQHNDTNTASIVSLPMTNSPQSRIGSAFPNGLRMMVTKGFDVQISDVFENFPYPVLKEEIIAFQDNCESCQIGHRIIGDGWRSILLRPNALYFPTLETPIVVEGNSTL